MENSRHERDNSAPCLTDESQVGKVLSQYRHRLRRMVRLRMDRRLQGRIDTSDVLQEAFLEVNRRLPDYIDKPTMPFFVWVRFLVGQKIIEFHRKHLNVMARDAARDVSIFASPVPHHARHAQHRT